MSLNGNPATGSQLTPASFDTCTSTVGRPRSALLDGLSEELHHAARVLAHVTSQVEITETRMILAFP